MLNKEKKVQLPTESGNDAKPIVIRQSEPLPWWEEHIKDLEELKKVLLKRIKELGGDGA